MADEAAAQEAATALVASSVADLVVLIEGADLLTLTLALQAEQAREGGGRKDAIAALEAAIDGHPELAASAAADAEAVPPADTTPPVELVIDAAHREIADEAAATIDDAALAEQTVAMVHPDGGTCDLYPLNAEGQIVVPLGDVPLMREHGFRMVIA
ncbi:hypothetical protein GCM10008023_05910 [Sphingomonas glacialis]|uniref:Uncharacterized protein n=1 Tax=Sphingomonas glacialis TaxID=658225 RepID=A0ABQ3LA50_9SPHN|nr:hypothetical protein [Sphingomonas glacialis]GHH09344.1 hypothetical protein GCM10008023_05910 [Sphingomonas glacialis]